MKPGPKKGYKQSAEHIAKRSEARRGKTLTEPHRVNVSKGMKTAHAEGRAKVFAGGTSLSEEHRQKVSQTLRSIDNAGRPPRKTCALPGCEEPTMYVQG